MKEWYTSHMTVEIDAEWGQLYKGLKRKGGKKGRREGEEKKQQEDLKNLELSGSDE